MHTLRARAVLLLVAFGFVGCSSSSPAGPPSGELPEGSKVPHSSKLVAAALAAFDRAVTVPQDVVSHDAKVPQTRTIANSLVGVERLRELDDPSCGGIGSMSVYSVTADPDALWRQLRNVGGEVWAARTKFDGRRVRLLTESGYDYNITAVMLAGRGRTRASLLVQVCS